MRLCFHFSILFFVALFSQSVLSVETIKADHIQIDWLAPKSFSVKEETLIGIRFRTDPHWHVYWKNPGDSGAAPKFKIASKNAEVGEILWPIPARLPIAHLTNFGYDGEVAYLFKIKAKGPNAVQLDVDLEWLVCQEECIPGLGKLSLSRPITQGPTVFDSAVESKIKFFNTRIPSDGKISPYQVVVNEQAEGILKVTVSSQASLPNKLDLFPTETDYVLPAQPKISRTESQYEVIFQTSAAATKPTTLGFLLVADDVPYEFSKLELSSTPVSAELTSFGVILVLLGSAFLGGILLNLMPCVFPVISIKAVSLLKTENARERMRDGFLYTAGVLTTFAGLGAGFLILRHLGSAVGWGFQLQSPLVVLSLAILFWLMALNFLGVFEFGTKIMNTSGNIRWQSSFGLCGRPLHRSIYGNSIGCRRNDARLSSHADFYFFGLGTGDTLLSPDTQ